MAYETGVPSSIEDLVDKLFTFLTGATAAWVQDELDLTNNYGTIHKGDCFVSFRWDATNNLAHYQSLGWTTSLLPHQHPDNSGNGDTTLPIDSGRMTNFTAAGPYVAYHFFASDDAPYYCHVVVEVSSGVYRHFGFGAIDKIGDWVGGEYHYGHYWYQLGTYIDDPTASQHTFGLDARYGESVLAATMHLEGVGSMGASQKWGVFSSGASPGQDTAGQARALLIGGPRCSLWGALLAWMPVAQLGLYKSLLPVPVLYRDPSTTPHTWILLGHQRDVSIVNMKNVSPGAEITVAGDTWVVFPWTRKQFLAADTEESWNAGIAYKKVV